MTSDRVLIGIDLGGTKIRSMAFDPHLNVLGEDYRETEAHLGRDAVIERMTESARAAAGGRPILAAGVSTPGPSNPKLGIVTTPPNLPGWHNVHLAEAISKKLGVPAWLENDANAAALAEHKVGAGKGLSHMILVTLGTGIGGGLVLDGRLYHGASGGAGEIGHIRIVEDGPACGCGARGCLEAVASGIALGREAVALALREPSGILAKLSAEAGEEPDARLLGDAADAGDEAADMIIRKAGRHLGAGLRSLVNLFDPEMIVIGGSLRRFGERYLGEAMAVVDRDAFKQHLSDVRIVEAELGDEAPCVGAVLVARDRVQEQQVSGSPR
jgi:glucokinase